MSTDSVTAVLDRCRYAGAWDGQPIHSLQQRNSLNDTPLHTVCTWGEVESARILIEAGADVNAAGDTGNTPLFNAVMGESIEVVRLLIEHGADASRSNDDGKAPAKFARNVGSADIAAFLEQVERNARAARRSSK